MRTVHRAVPYVLLLWGGIATAQTLKERPAVLPLSLKRAVEIALSPEGNARVQLADESIRQAHDQSLESRAALLPNFDAVVSEQSVVRNLATLGIDFSSLIPIPGLHIPTIAGPFNVFDVRVSGSQNVFDLSTIRRFQASKVVVEAAKSDAQGTRDQIASQVARGYLAALRADADLETARANVDLSEALVKLAQHQKNAGTGTGIEITRAEVQLANDRQRMIVAENDRDRTHLELLRTLGLRMDGEVQLTDRLAYKPVDAMTAEQAVKSAMETRPELKAQRQRESNARLNYSATKWERLPSVSFFGDYGSTGTGIDAAFPTRDYGVSLRVPVFDGGRRDARRAEADSVLRQQEVRTRDLRDAVELDVRVALKSVQSADAQVASSREGVQLAENELAQARRRYEAGVTTSVEVTDAQTRLQRARDNQTAALFNHNLARIDLSAAMGTIEDLVNNY